VFKALFSNEAGLKFVIPPGAFKTGSRVRVRGKGQVNPSATGDLYLKGRILLLPFFTLREDNLHL